MTSHDTTLSTRTLGATSPLTLSTMGLGCMGMSEFYGTTDEAETTATIHRALDLWGW
jgi:aryl-alcohol dehydrogenase-like predicted oxidoreductase